MFNEWVDANYVKKRWIFLSGVYIVGNYFVLDMDYLKLTCVRDYQIEAGIIENTRLGLIPLRPRLV